MPENFLKPKLFFFYFKNLFGRPRYIAQTYKLAHVEIKNKYLENRLKNDLKFKI